MGFRKPTIGLKGYTLKTLGRNISQNQARDEEIFTFLIFQKKLPKLFFFNKKIAMFLHIVQTSIQDIKKF
jgi:hypothetical protein